MIFYKSQIMSQRDLKSFKCSSLYSKFEVPRDPGGLPWPGRPALLCQLHAGLSHPALAAQTSCLFRLTRLPRSLALALGVHSAWGALPLWVCLADLISTLKYCSNVSFSVRSTLLPLLNLAAALFSFFPPL